MKQFNLKIVTPFGKYFDTNVDYVLAWAPHSGLGIYANHTPLVSTLRISKLKIMINGVNYYYAIGGGVISITNEDVTLLVDSIERQDEIDIERAKESKKRAEERLTNKDPNIDVKRAEAALSRALNRIDVHSTK